MPSKADETLLETARKRFQLCVDAERKIRESALADLEFRAGDQWEPSIRAQREAKFRPCLTLNVLPAREKQILNDLRQNRPAIKVHPVDDKGDQETAEVFQGLIRHIEYDSNADVAYDTAVASAVRGGFGYYRIVTEYENPFSPNQVLKVKRVRNPFTVYVDPNCQEPDYSDAKFYFVFEDLTKDEYRSQYPDSDLAGIDDWTSIGDTPPDWLAKDSVRIAEYWYIEETPETLVTLRDGSSAIKSSLPEGFSETEIVAQRETRVPVVRFCKHNAQEVLERVEWRGRWIPIIPVLGDELDVDGERSLEGLVRHVKDAVKMGNMMASAQVETIGMVPRSPWLVAEGQIAGYEDLWNQANRENLAYLPYKPTDLMGQPVQPPQRLISEPAVQAITQARLQFNDDLKAITGMYDAQLGQRSNETSGRGILARQQQGQLGNFHYSDNLTRAQRHEGRILVDLIPKIYDTPRVLRIIGEDGEQKTTLVNGHMLGQDDPRLQGVKNIYDLSAGTYDVTVASGPSFQTRRLEAVASQLEVIRSVPQLFPLVGDLIAKNMDWPGADEWAKRLKKSLPPGLADEEQQPISPQAQAMMQQQAQMVEQLTAHLNAANQKLEAKVPELESRERIEMRKLEVQVLVAEIEAKAQESLIRMKMENQVWSELHGAASDHLMQATDQRHEDMQRQAAQEAAAQQAQPPAEGNGQQPPIPQV
jgi:hypothetical protein